MALPVELISNIIFFLAPGFEDDLVGPAEELDHAKDLGRCTTLNSSWHSVAQKELYRRIFIDHPLRALRVFKSLCKYPHNAALLVILDVRSSKALEVADSWHDLLKRDSESFKTDFATSIANAVQLKELTWLERTQIYQILLHAPSRKILVPHLHRLRKLEIACMDAQSSKHLYAHLIRHLARPPKWKRRRAVETPPGSGRFIVRSEGDSIESDDENASEEESDQDGEHGREGGLEEFILDCKGRSMFELLPLLATQTGGQLKVLQLNSWNLQDFEPEDIQQIARRIPYLQKLRLMTGIRMMPLEILPLLQACHRTLVDLELGMPFVLRELRSLHPYIANLRMLDITVQGRISMAFKTRLWPKLITLVKKLKNIETLRIHVGMDGKVKRPRLLIDEGFMQTLMSSRWTTSLHELELVGMQMTLREVDMICSTCRKLRNLNVCIPWGEEPEKDDSFAVDVGVQLAFSLSCLPLLQRVSIEGLYEYGCNPHSPSDGAGRADAILKQCSKTLKFLSDNFEHDYWISHSPNGGWWVYDEDEPSSSTEEEGV